MPQDCENMVKTRFRSVLAQCMLGFQRGGHLFVLFPGNAVLTGGIG